MREKIEDMISLAKQMEYAERSAEWFDSGVSDSLRTAAKLEKELEESIEKFLKEYDTSTTGS